MPNPKRRHSKRRTSARRTHDSLNRSGSGGMPQLPRAQTPAPRVPALRKIQGPRSDRGRRRIARPAVSHADHRGRRHGGRSRPQIRSRRRDSRGSGSCRQGDPGGPGGRGAQGAGAAPARPRSCPSKSSTPASSSPWRIRRPKPSRTKKDSSISVASRLMREGEAQGVVSAGNTGAVMATAKIVQGMIRGVDRPALASALPTLNGLARGGAGCRRQCRFHAGDAGAVRGDGRDLFAHHLPQRAARAWACSRSARKSTRATI